MERSVVRRVFVSLVGLVAGVIMIYFMGGQPPIVDYTVLALKSAAAGITISLAVMMIVHLFKGRST